MFDNPYSRQIASQVAMINNRHIEHMNNLENHVNDVTTPLEGMALRHEHVHGGSGFASATVQDLGFEPAEGMTGSGSSG